MVYTVGLHGSRRYCATPWTLPCSTIALALAMLGSGVSSNVQLPEQVLVDDVIVLCATGKSTVLSQ